MALATNTQTTYQTVGIREDLSNVVSRDRKSVV